MENMIVLIFSHISDIDGMGGVILAKLTFRKVDYVLCETFNLQEKLKTYCKDNHIYDYDKIFITDMWLEEPMLTSIANDKKLKDKLFIFDHHESALNENVNKYSFINIKISNSQGLCSGTSLFYEYLINNKYLLDNSIIKEFVELTREYDTWEWKTKYNNENPHKLSLLFDSVGCDNYINLMINKLKSNKNFKFNKLENMLISNKINKLDEKVKEYIQKIFYTKILNFKAGIIFIDYEYRNDIAEYIRQIKIDIDFVMLIALDYGTISYRSIKDNISVRKIAETFGGKGHDKAASSPINDAVKKKIIEFLTKTNF